MSSTYSSYKIELIGTGEQAGTWGTTTNTNFSTAVEQAIGGYVSVTFTGLTKTLTLTNTNAAQDARALYLNLIGSPGGTATLELPAIQKAYIIKNSTTGGYTVTAKVTGMTGVVIPNGSTMMVYNNGTDVVVSVNNFNDGLTLGTTVLSVNSASDALRITQIGSGNALVVEDEANPDSSRFQIDSTGRVSIGTTTPGVSNLRISRTLTGGTSGAAVYSDYTVASDVTGSAASYRSDVTTQATAFTLPFLTHYTVTGLTVGAGSTVTDQRGYNVSAAAVGATNNHGLYSAIPAGTNNWNIYNPGTAPNYMAGALGIGSTTLTGFKIRTGNTLDGSGGAASDIFTNSTIQSTVTSVYYGHRSFPATQATAFTLSNLYHFVAEPVSLGAGSAVTTQIGYYATGTGATNNYGLVSGLAAGANNWNLYASGAANNYMAGNLGLGSTSLTGFRFRLAGASGDSGSGTASAVYVNPTFDSTVTNFGYVFRSSPNTTAAAYTLSALYHFLTDTTTIGAGSTLSNNYLFFGSNTSATGSNNYSFYSNVAPSAANNWNLYFTANTPSYMAGALGIGSTNVANLTNLRISRNLTGGATQYSIMNQPQFMSDVTSQAVVYRSFPSTEAAAFTAVSIQHYVAENTTIGAGSTVTNQYGFFAGSGLTGATNNYGFLSNIAASGANNWNLYSQGTAPNYMGGALGIGTATLTGYNLHIARQLTGATTSYAVGVTSQTQSDVTTASNSFISAPSTQATAFTLPAHYHYVANDISIGAGSAVTNQRGFTTFTHNNATNNFGFYGGVNTGAGSNWNFYANGTAPNYMGGGLGIGTTVVGSYNFRIQRNLTGGVNGSSFSNDFTALSDVTTNVHGIYSLISTQDAVYTLTNLQHFTAAGGTRGASSTITFQYGFLAQSTLSQATNNYGIYSSVTASGANNWNLFSQGTAPNYMAGALGIGNTALTGYNLRLSRNLTGAATSWSISNEATVQSDVTTNAVGYNSFITTQATAFTLGLISHFLANGSVGAGSTVTNQYGFAASSGLTQATNNYAFYGNIPASGSSNWNTYNTGTANNYMAGALGIGTTTLTGYNLAIGRQLTGATTAASVRNVFTSASDVTVAAYAFQSQITTPATAYTLGSALNYVAEGINKGAGSTVTSQFGFTVSSGFTAATNNYGFRSDIPAGASNWNLYNSGTAPNYMAGALGIGATSSTASLAVNRNLTGATANSQVVCSYTVLSDVTSTAYTFESLVQTQAAAFTIGNLGHYHVSGLLLGGGGSAVTNQYGFLVDDIFGATNNYGFYSRVASGANKWGFYANGTANNAFNGKSRFGDVTAPVATVDVTGNVAATTSILSTGATSGVGYATGAGGAVTQLTSRTTGVTLNNVSGAITLVSAAGSAAYQTFTVTNSAVAATDVVIVNQKSGTDKYITMVTTVAAGSFQITFATTGGTTTEQPVFNFAVIKAVAA